ncbi:Alcohol dehydrogenase superfamily, zinc-type [Niveomyces insectorum RCEF 264]|uniref:Alcohol dehydrogenase superfamily, zinc-type n=1 Tax=Niveomyces insectorum RCEF 264 TaxID=1081102 RepID=A0A167XR10_9HYPO|nr:Alcohol dehydrogenase superfamily, zinc-type [Niveomyces insectorum RCEF 264]
MAADTILAAVLHGPRDMREVRQPPFTVEKEPSMRKEESVVVSQLTKPNQETRTIPPPAPDEIQVAVKATGLCGSDLHFYTHGGIGDFKLREPMSLGHESAGVVVAVGSAVATSANAFAPGDRVALEVGKPCDRCDLCAAGRYHLCKAMQFRASARLLPHIQGTLQERINHPARWAYKLPDGMPLEFGALAEPLSVALHAQDRSGLALAPGGANKVLVLGAGSVGLLCAAVSRVAGAAAVVVADLNAARVAFAVENGFADAGVVVPRAEPSPQSQLPTTEDKLARARALAAQIGAVDVKGTPFGEAAGTYECTGAEACTQTAIYATQPGGKVMMVGLGMPVQTLPVTAAAIREVDLVGVFRYNNTYRRVIDLLASKNPLLPPVDKLVSHRFQGIGKAAEAFEMATQVKDANGKLVLKVVIDM